MAEHIVAYAEIDGFKPPKGEEVVEVAGNGNGAYVVTTKAKSAKD